MNIINILFLISPSFVELCFSALDIHKSLRLDGAVSPASFHAGTLFLFSTSAAHTVTLSQEQAKKCSASDESEIMKLKWERW